MIRFVHAKPQSKNLKIKHKFKCFAEWGWDIPPHLQALRISFSHPAMVEGSVEDSLAHFWCQCAEAALKMNLTLCVLPARWEYAMRTPKGCSESWELDTKVPSGSAVPLFAIPGVNIWSCGTSWAPFWLITAFVQSPLCWGGKANAALTVLQLLAGNCQ